MEKKTRFRIKLKEVFCKNRIGKYGGFSYKMKKKLPVGGSGRARIAPALVLLLFGISMAGCTRERETIHITKSDFYFDTIIQITLYDDRQEALIDDCFAMAAEYEDLLSGTIDDSDISRINQAQGAPVTVSDDTISVLEAGLSYCELSGGVFDITLGAVINLWDIKNNPGVLPSQEELSRALESVGYESVSIQGNEVTLANPDTQVDLGAISKGWIADRMKEYLNSQGVTEGIINLGGNVLVLGPKSDGSAYRIGLQKPFDQDGNLLLSVDITDGTVVTSGNYQRYFELDGTIYHHIFDPDTGYPYQNGLLSVTILCPRSVDGDGLSTTCFALGLTDGLALIESLPDTEAVFITEDFEIVTSSGMGSTVPYEILE